MALANLLICFGAFEIEHLCGERKLWFPEPSNASGLHPIYSAVHPTILGICTTSNRPNLRSVLHRDIHNQSCVTAPVVSLANC